MNDAPTEPSGRRPLRSRNVELFRALARWLARKGVTPNAISGASMAFGSAAGAAFVATRYSSEVQRCALFIAAAALIQLRLLCNLLDGLVAVECGRKTPTGDIWNEVPDRVSDVATLVGAGYAAGSAPELGYIAAVLAVLTAYVRAFGASLGAGQIFDGYGAKQQRMAILTVFALFSAVTARMPGSYLMPIVLVATQTVMVRLWKIRAFLRTRAA